MPGIDWPLEQCRTYKPALTRESDFDAFWDSTISAAIAQPLNAEFIPCPIPAKRIACDAVRFDGFGGGRLAAWYVRPDADGPFPAICVYHGYSGRGTRPLDLLTYAYNGFAVLSLDCRGQNGQSQDAHPYAEGHRTGWMTRGIRSPKDYYYRHVYADAVRALELLASRPQVDASRIAVTGGSQGGALTLAAAALSERPVLALPDIPFLCDFRRSISICGVGPYPEIPEFLKVHPHLYEQAMSTLSYIDCMNLAPWITAKTVVLNCMWDDICPPSTIFAAYNHMTCEKHIEVYPFHKHETPYEHREYQLRVLNETLNR